MYRIFPIVQFRRLLKACLVFVIALTVSCILASIFQCIPIHRFWETLAGALAPELGGRCINVQLYFIISGAINTSTDFALLALVGTMSFLKQKYQLINDPKPIPILWRLRTGTPQKLLLTGIFTVGLTYVQPHFDRSKKVTYEIHSVCVVSVIRLIVLSQADQTDITCKLLFHTKHTPTH